MPSKRPNQQDLAHRIDGLAALLSALEEELFHLQEEGAVAPLGSLAAGLLAIKPEVTGSGKLDRI